MNKRAWVLAGAAALSAAGFNGPLIAQIGPTPSQPFPASTAAAPLPVVPVLDTPAKQALQRAINGNQRIDPDRDRWRNPAATLEFFGVRPNDTIIEIWPGQGWYTSILGPYLRQGNGRLIVAHFDASASNSAIVRQMVDAFKGRFSDDPGRYGSVSVVPFGPRSAALAPPNSIDKVLTFRNVHNWMAQGWTERAFAEFYTALKPGGILGIEEHRGRTDEPQDPLARDGYVREDFVIQLAREAGFEFIGGSELNANPADTKDHPFGVWTLPPVSRTSPIGEPDDPGFDRRRYDQIGESDRMTLRFRKPLTANETTSASTRPPASAVKVTIVPAPPPPPRTIAPPIVRVLPPPPKAPPPKAPLPPPPVSTNTVVSPTTIGSPSLTPAAPSANMEQAQPATTAPAPPPPLPHFTLPPLSPPIAPPPPPQPVVRPNVSEAAPVTMEQQPKPQVISPPPAPILPPPPPPQAAPQIEQPVTAPAAPSGRAPADTTLSQPNAAAAAPTQATRPAPPSQRRSPPSAAPPPPAMPAQSLNERPRAAAQPTGRTPTAAANPAPSRGTQGARPAAIAPAPKRAPAARPPTKSPPPSAAKKKASPPPPPRDPNKPDWVLPRKRK